MRSLAALQFVRKVTGVNKPSRADQEVFAQAVEEVAAITERLLAALLAHGPVRTREGERQKAKARWARRVQGQVGPG
jgi:hypothetical protein